MDIRKLNESIKKYLKEEQINELSPQTIQNYVKGRQKQVDDLTTQKQSIQQEIDSKIGDLTAKKQIVTKNIKKYKNKLDDITSKTLVGLFGKDYTSTSVDYMNVSINPAVYGEGFNYIIKINDEKRKIQAFKFSFKGSPNKVKKLTFNCTPDYTHSLEFLPKDIEILDMGESFIERKNIQNYLRTVGKVKELSCDNALDALPIKTDVLRLYSPFWNNDSLASCGCNTLILDQSNYDCAYKLNEKNIKPINGKLSIITKNGEVTVITSCIYCTELQRWFDNEAKMKNALQYENSKLSKENKANNKTKKISNESELYIEATDGVDGSTSTSITYEEFCKMSKRELKEKIAYAIDDNSSEFSCGNDIVLEDLTITSISFDKEAQIGYAKGKWSGEVYSDYGNSKNINLKVEFELTFE